MHIIDAISRWAGRITAYMVLLITGVLVYEVIIREIFGTPTIWGYETAGMLFGAYSIMLGAYTYLHSGHVRMDALYGRWNTQTQARVDVVTGLLTIAFLCVFLWLAVASAHESWTIKERSGSAWGPPIYPLQMVVCLGVSILLLQAIVNWIRDLSHALKGGK
jgi:TRAP-type mannitol/chloroaromatic compound transport system permease small subunit